MTAHTFCISVPIGSYHPFLPDCLESLAQQEAPLQIALLDASGDERVRKIADQYDAHLAYRRHGPDAGQSDAIAEGWRHTSGDVLGWLNADDILFPGAMARARAAFLADQTLDVVYGHSTILNEDSEVTGYHWAVEKPGPRLLEAGIISQPSCFFKRAAYDSCGGLNSDLHYTMDWDLWIRLYKHGAKFGFIDDVLSMVLWGDGTKTSSFNRQRRDELKGLIREHAPGSQAAKTFRSFAIHNILDRIPSEKLRKTITRNLIKNRAEIFGISGDGQLSDGAKLMMTHYHTAPKSGIRLFVENASLVDHISITNTDLDAVIRSDAHIDIKLKERIDPGAIVAIDFSIRPSGAAYFQRAAWQ